MSSKEITQYDYVVVGAGASGMSFIDTLLSSHPSSSSLSVALIDPHSQPGGHWNDDYPWVRLHQPATNYGVEGTPLEKYSSDQKELLASRTEILSYYREVLQRYVEQGQVTFFPRHVYDFERCVANSIDSSETKAQSIVFNSPYKLVDARFTQNDLPIFVKPKFTYSNQHLNVIPVNDLPSSSARHYVVVGGGKTGQDAVLYLQTERKVAVDDIMWIVPNDFWITARDPADERMDTCTEFLSTAFSFATTALNSASFMHETFRELERRGKVYRFSDEVLPSKFMNATLNRAEVSLIKQITNVNRKGRLAAIADDGTMTFVGGETEALPWDVQSTAFVHCSSGAFNFSATAQETRPPVFSTDRITIQEVFQYPGFCFNGSLIAKLECDQGLTLGAKNDMCELPPVSSAKDENNLLGPSAGAIGPLHVGHSLAVSTRNAKKWYTHGLGPWLHKNRLFSLAMNKYNTEEGQAMVEANWRVLQNV